MVGCHGVIQYVLTDSFIILVIYMHKLNIIRKLYRNVSYDGLSLFGNCHRESYRLQYIKSN